MSVIVPANVSNITLAVKQMWQDDPAVGGDDVLVQRYAELNNNPNPKGWACIYRARVEYPPRVLGMGSGFRNQLIRLFAIAQHSDITSGEEAGERLDELLQKLVGTLLSDPSLKGTVQTLDEFSVDYFDYQRQQSGIYLQRAQLNFTGVIPVSVM